MPDYLFARHGQSVVNLTRVISNRVTDYTPLTERRRAQARELLAAIQARPVSAVYSSPLTRARETAQILADGLGLTVQIADGLREPFCGIAEGRSDAQAWRMHAAQEQAWQAGDHDYHIPGGESFNDLRARFLPFVEALLARHRAEDGTVVAVSHGSLLMNMLPLVLDNIDTAFTHAAAMKNACFALARPVENGLACVEWCGILVEDRRPA